MNNNTFNIDDWLEAVDKNFQSDFDWIAWYENVVKEFDYKKFFEAIACHTKVVLLARKLKHDKFFSTTFKNILVSCESIIIPPPMCCLRV